ncbi:AraC family transcriptional regulator [Skermania piniformis]|uniref:AraC family transcriptional regulator n=1 Tax=Skermania pinensis TaxID=39122 RepID=A0ABX8S427_9ACTN|nr:AraC family transcriptional regulator [Skermania piniformis]QXQ12577.1 AraC family transcriptional regulator [Skermania piniformis]
MVEWDVPRSPTSLGIVVELGAELGVPPAVCLRGTGLSAVPYGDSNHEVSARQELTAIGNLLTATNDRAGLGLDVGSRYHLTTYGIWGFALLSSPTLRVAVDLGLRYLDLTFAFSRVVVREPDGAIRLVLDTPDIPARFARFAVERDAAAMMVIQHDLFRAPVPSTAVRFAFPPPDDVQRYAEVFGVVPEFEAAENVVEMSSEYLDLPLPQANAHTGALAQAQCRDLLQRRRTRGGLAGQVCDLIRSEPATPPNAERIAAALHVSSRTLRQRLAAEGTSFRELLDEIREQLAEEMLADGLTVAEIAERLGYAEVSSLSQAFRRWKGVSPRAYRSRSGGG